MEQFTTRAIRSKRKIVVAASAALVRAGDSAADYAVSSRIAYGQIAAAGAVTGNATTRTVGTGINQDACERVTVPLYSVAS